uniref:CHK kinase-like domain-containing protein n=1 Tax=Phlebotomus papatasi TaxID=29031 RepID=A0A1B0DI70_PHLPP
MSLSEHISLAFTEDKLKEILRKEGNYKLKGYQLVDGFSKKGDSYLSEVFRLRIDGEEPGCCSSTCLNFVVKGLPKNIGRRKTFRSAAFFKNEITFYEDIIPAFEDFQARRSPKKPFIEYPRCYSSFCDGNHDYVALDDLSKYGFVSADRQNGMDFEHCRLALESLGRLHALSLAMKDQEPENFAKLSQKSQSMVHSSQTISTITCLLVMEMAGHPTFLFKYDASSGDAGPKVPKEIRIIDFQLARCATLAIDISFFIYSCTTQKLREKHYDDLLKAYHSVVAGCLRTWVQSLKSFPIRHFRRK